MTTDQIFSETEELVIWEEVKLRLNIRKSWLCLSSHCEIENPVH